MGRWHGDNFVIIILVVILIIGFEVKIKLLENFSDFQFLPCQIPSGGKVNSSAAPNPQHGNTNTLPDSPR